MEIDSMVKTKDAQIIHYLNWFIFTTNKLPVISLLLLEIASMFLNYSIRMY